LHDSNAALIASRGSEGRGRGEATLLSTGTWFVAMRSRSASDAPEPLPEGRDCLINVDVDGRPVPSVRFMGGREIEHLGGADGGGIEIAADWPALLRVLAEQTMALPTLVPACGPFPSAEGGWITEPEDRNARCAAIALYAALMADASLDLIGAARTLIIEGRFARAEVFVRALAALRPHTAVFTADAARDVSFGALRLLDPKLRPAGRLERVLPLAADLGAYRARWYDEIARRSAFEAKDG
jgi:hypothetical protein